MGLGLVVASLGDVSRGFGSGHASIILFCVGPYNPSFALLSQAFMAMIVVHRLFIISFACQEFGDINRIKQDKEANRLILTFTTRKQAEIVSF